MLVLDSDEELRFNCLQLAVSNSGHDADKTQVVAKAKAFEEYVRPSKSDA